ncbi:MAG TPA: ABC transporter permease [Gaiellaceae bacterium]|nr:ABC transporter permease [Gaiellaceae bacterium]
MIGRMWAALLANLRMLVRDRGALFLALFLPILFMVIFGLIFGNAGNQKLDVGLAGRGPLVQALEQTPALNVHRVPAQTAARRVKDGRYQGAVVVDGKQATLYYSNTYAAQAAMLRGVVQGVADGVNLAAANQPQIVSVEPVSVDSSSLRYIDFLVPGLLAMALSQSAVFGVSGTLVSWRERGIFRRLKVTPLPLGEFGFVRLLTHLVVALAQAAVLLLVGRLFFGVHLGVDVAALVPLVIVGALCFIAIGFLVGAIASTQEAASIAGNLITLPMVFLAGVFFSLDTAPSWLQQTAKFLPLTYLANGLRDVAIRGHSVASTLPDLAVLGGVALAVSLLSIHFFRWETQV